MSRPIHEGIFAFMDGIKISNIFIKKGEIIEIINKDKISDSKTGRN